MTIGATECPPTLYPLAEACGSNGQCVSAVECACPEGFTGTGDFVAGSPSCIINVQAVQVLWGLTAAAWLCMGVYVVHCLVLFVRYPPRASIKRKVFFLLLTLLCSATFGFVGIARASDPLNTAIGTHQATTVAFAFGAASFWVSCLVFSVSFIFVLARQGRIKGQAYMDKVELLQKQLLVIYPLMGLVIMAAAFAMPIAMLSVDKTTPGARWTMYGLALGHYIGLALTMTLLGFFCIRACCRAAAATGGGGHLLSTHNNRALTLA